MAIQKGSTVYVFINHLLQYHFYIFNTGIKYQIS